MQIAAHIAIPRLPSVRDCRISVSAGPRLEPHSSVFPFCDNDDRGGVCLRKGAAATVQIEVEISILQSSDPDCGEASGDRTQIKF